MVYLASVAFQPPKFASKRLQRPATAIDLPPLVWPTTPGTTPPASSRSSPSSGASVSPKAISPEYLDKLRSKVLQASFFLADKDGDKQLSKAEFALMLRRTNHELKQSQIDRAFLLASLGCGPKISYDAFVQWARKDHKDEADDDSEPLLAVFRLWDMDEDEAISRPELEYVVKKAFPKTKKEDLQQLLSLMDEDRDGEVGYLEFVNFIFPPEQAAPSAQVSARVMGG